MKRMPRWIALLFAILCLAVVAWPRIRPGPSRPTALPGHAATAATPSPTIVFDTVPPYGATGAGAVLRGRVLHADPAAYHLTVVILVHGRYWTKPWASAPAVTLTPTGGFSVRVATGGTDGQAERIVAMLLPVTVPPPVLLGAPAIPDGLPQQAVATQEARRLSVTQVITWSDLNWRLKDSGNSAVGPGPCYFSAENVSVDAQGRLHLRISFRDGQWRAAEVIAEDHLGYGRYEWEVAGPVQLDIHAVLGLFTWSDIEQYSHREIDIELARWSDPADSTNSQYVVQPYDVPGNLHRFTLELSTAEPIVHLFEWRPGEIRFASRTVARVTLQEFSYRGPDVPTPGDENARMNLWLFNGTPPAGPVEVVINRFRFTPLAP